MKYGTGAIPDLPDLRDHSYEQAFGSPVLTKAEWDEGYDVEEEFGVKLKQEDQGSSSSCVGQSVSKLFELKLIEKYGRDYLKDYSARWIYANVSLGAGQGAYIRDGMKWAADYGSVEEVLASSYENGKPPSETFMLNKADMTQMIYDQAKKVDVFNYRVIEGKNIDTIAHAIKTHKGVVLGFLGTNEGWQTGKVRPPKDGETIWGHAIVATRFGKENGVKYVSGLNSWSGQWGLGGYWLVDEEGYFAEHNLQYVFNPWMFVYDNLMPNEVKIMDFLNRNQGKIIQDSEQSGSFALVKGDKVLVASRERIAELIATYIVQKEGVPTSKDIWNSLPKVNF